VLDATDYDLYYADEVSDAGIEAHAEVDIRMVLENLSANADNARELIRRALPAVAAAPRDEAIAHAAEHAVITAPELRPPQAVERLRGVIDGL
jgi:hypothetical protein